MTQSFVVNTTIGFLATAPKKLFLPPAGRDLRIRWKQSKSASVVVTVETRAGEVVRTLAKRRYDAGAQAVTWNGLDRTKKAVKGGWYVVRVVARNPLGTLDLGKDLRVQRIVGRSSASPRRNPRACEVQCPDARSLAHELVDAARRRLRPLRRLRPDDDRRRLPGRQRDRDGLRRRDRVGRDRRDVGDAVRLHVRAGAPGLPRDRRGRDDRVPDRLVIGWEIGRRGGRPYLEQHGRWLHLDHAKLERAEAWFQRWEDWAVLLGRLTPVVRSFVSIPAGIFEVPFRRYTVLTLIGSAIWCFVFAGAGWAAGASWESFHHAFRFADVLVGAAIVAAAAWLVWRFVRKRRA